MFKLIRKWLNERAERAEFMESVHHWHRAGASAPFAAASDERRLRLKLEEFRNFASKRYLEDPTLLPADLKQEWLEEEVKPMAKCEFTRDAAKALRVAVQVMGEEMFVGLAAQRRKEHMEATVRECKELAPKLWKQQRERAMLA